METGRGKLTLRFGSNLSDESPCRILARAFFPEAPINFRLMPLFVLAIVSVFQSAVPPELIEIQSLIDRKQLV